ncbi:Acyl-CoA synthetase (NDP forming) [Cognatiyoonia koreensis]|uniref:Acyl-CoA synthetase (NDP forming) n=1 Tax=Cognatiyoonia koreensis TaxID=364200 RepID=A0A1I0RKV8_9RHOB|nr:acetate--CoA ligase family protein [Cognatiyoonia koreensis]SEW41730.1 Acyl-CoA synthetase (NDP forming) [Cognatiyoonia koreensis]
MTADLTRLMRFRSLAVIGGGAWGEAVVQQAQKFGFSGNIWPIHPSRDKIAGLRAYRGVPDLPAPPDAAFIGINRDATIGAVERLRRANAGGAVCFASGFAEAQAEDATGGEAQSRLLRAAGDLPVLGPNCYGFINALDGAIIWPDQHGMTRVDRGVAILTQSSNIAINLTFQKRSLPIAMMITCGNMAQLSQAAIAYDLLDDPRITAIGFHIEGFGDIAAWEAVARKAHGKDIPLVALKAGLSEAARIATQSHTASLAGDDTGAQALLDALGIGRVQSPTAFLEALKLGHVCGRLASANVASISCSGGEASLAADIGQDKGVHFPPLRDDQEVELRDVLGPKVALANPLDYHTYIWRDPDRMAAAWSQMVSDAVAITLTIVDVPDATRADPADWQCAIDAAIKTKIDTGGCVALVATLPENLPTHIAEQLLAAGVAPLQGLSDAMSAVAALVRRVPKSGILSGAFGGPVVSHSEATTKAALAEYGVPVPRGASVAQVATLAFPVAMKRTDLLHKTDKGGVILDLPDVAAVHDAIAKLPDASAVLIEEMVQECVAELLVAFLRDPAHGIVLTIGAGGTLTELWQDTQHILLPVTADDIESALARLRIAPLLAGYRGGPAADRGAIVEAILRLQAFVVDHASGFVELEVNPLICTPQFAIAADALWSQSMPEEDT